MLFEKMQLESDEKVIAIVRKHWWIIVLEVAVVLALALAPFIILQLIATFSAVVLGDAGRTVHIWLVEHTVHIVYLYSLWLLGLWMLLGNFWTDYYLDLWAITSKRVILVDQRGFFHRFISSFRLERLQDMNIEINGFMATLLDYGTIEAQTAGGSNEEFISHLMAHPRDIKALIVTAADELTSSQSSRISALKDEGI